MSCRPLLEVYGVTIYNDQVAATLEWIPMQLEVDSWVTLKAMQTRKWVRDARAYGEESFAGAWKVQIRGFKWIPCVGNNG